MANCSNITGSSEVVRFKEETNFGVTENTGFETLYIISNGISFNQNLLDSEKKTGGRQQSKAIKGNIEVGGTIETTLDPISSGLWFKSLLGSVSTETDFVPGKNKHTFTINDTCLPSFQLEKELKGSDIAYRALGLKANTFSMTLGEEGELKSSIDVIGTNEYKTNIVTDAASGDLTVDININTKTFDLVDASDFNEGDIVTLVVKKGEIEADTPKGRSTIELGAGEGANIDAYEYLTIGGISYKVKAISGDVIYLSRSLETDLTAGTAVFNTSETNAIETIAGNTITLLNGIKQNMIAATDIISGESLSTELVENAFESFEGNIGSDTQSDFTTTVSNMTFNFDNQSEGKTTINSKGSFGKIYEGKTMISCEMTLLFDRENAEFLEDAKVGREFDIFVEAANNNGDTLKIKFPQGTLTPKTPEITSTTAIEVTVEYKPHKTDSNDSIVIELLNEKASY